MKANWIAPALVATLVLGGCVAERKVAPVPASSPVYRPSPTPPPTVVAPPADWRDAEFSVGDWSHSTGSTGSVATYGSPGAAPLLTLRCDRPSGRVLLSRAGAASGQVPLTTVTTNGSRAFTATAQEGAVPTIAVSFIPRDPTLDAIAFSRGRWAVEVPGLPTLTLPAWPEVARVIEDCR